MSRRRIMIPLSIVLFLGVSPSVSADLTAEQQKTAEALIAQFTAPEFATRQQAVDKLVALGPDVLPVVQKTLAETKDNEVRLRCEMVLRLIADRTRRDHPSELARMNLDASRITLSAKDTPLQEILQALAEQSGNRPILCARNLEGKTASLDVKDLAYWEVVARICDQVNARFEHRGLHPKDLMLQPGLRPRNTITCAGPLIVRIEQVSVSRDYVTGDSRLGFDIHAFWEERFPVVATDVEITKMSAGGAALPAPKPPRLSPVNTGLTHDQYVLLYLRFGVDVTGIPQGMEKIDELSGTICLELGTGEKRLSVAVGGGTQAEAAADGLALALTRAAPPDGYGDRPAFQVKASRDAKEFRPSDYSLFAQYGFFLMDAAGKRIAKGTWLAVNQGRPERPVWKEPPTLVFESAHGVPEGSSVVYVYPAQTVHREYPFKFENAALP